MPPVKRATRSSLAKIAAAVPAIAARRTSRRVATGNVDSDNENNNENHPTLGETVLVEEEEEANNNVEEKKTTTFYENDDNEDDDNEEDDDNDNEDEEEEEEDNQVVRKRNGPRKVIIKKATVPVVRKGRKPTTTLPSVKKANKTTTIKEVQPKLKRNRRNMPAVVAEVVSNVEEENSADVEVPVKDFKEEEIFTTSISQEKKSEKKDEEILSDNINNVADVLQEEDNHKEKTFGLKNIVEEKELKEEQEDINKLENHEEVKKSVVVVSNETEYAKSSYEDDVVMEEKKYPEELVDKIVVEEEKNQVLPTCIESSTEQEINNLTENKVEDEVSSVTEEKLAVELEQNKKRKRESIERIAAQINEDFLEQTVQIKKPRIEETENIQDNEKEIQNIVVESNETASVPEIISRRQSDDDPSSQQRNKRMFGFIKNTLHKASVEQAQMEGTMKKREDILSTASLRLNREQSEHETREKKRINLELKVDSAHAALSRWEFLGRVGYRDHLNCFLQTTANPPLYWRPAKYTEKTERMLEDQIALRAQRNKIIYKSIERKIEESEQGLTIFQQSETESVI